MEVKLETISGNWDLKQVEYDIVKVSEGVHLLQLQVSDCGDSFLLATGSDENDNLTVAFSKFTKEWDKDENIFQFTIGLKNGYLFGEMNKGIYYGTFYDFDVYEKLLENNKVISYRTN